jgi:chaperonin GroEL
VVYNTGGAGTRGENSDIKKRIETLKEQVQNMKATDVHKKLTERHIASLSSAVGVIRVGAPTQAETLYLQHKIEDAVYACKAALEEGSVPGGGICLRDIAEQLGPESILYEALRAPYEQIQANADGNLEIGADIIDPAKAIRLEVEHACPVASKLLTTKITIPEEAEKTPGEGYKEIGDAIKIFARYYGRQHGLLRDADLEAEQEGAQLLEQKIAQDNG